MQEKQMSRYVLGSIFTITLLFGACASTPRHETAAGKCARSAPCRSAEEGWIELFNGKDLTGWKLAHRHGVDSWSVQDGAMVNTTPTGAFPLDHGTDLVTTAEFGSVELYLEFNIPKNSNSGVFLKGQYEIQLLDSFGRPPGMGECGCLYGRVAPLVNASRPAGEWQSLDIVFHAPTLAPSGRMTKKARLTVYHNGTKILENIDVCGATGGPYAHEKERATGPIVLQGDHGTVSFRNIRIRLLE
jgi:hypothetical protein